VTAATFDRVLRMDNNETNSAYGNEPLRRGSLITWIRWRDSRDAATLSLGALTNVAGQVLFEVNPGQTSAIRERLPEDFGSATASNNFLATATDFVSTACFLVLATILVL
jgi:hypothetical protein